MDLMPDPGTEGGQDTQSKDTRPVIRDSPVETTKEAS